MRCRHPACGREATHGVYFQPGRQRWTAYVGGSRHAAPLAYCRWHAIVEAVLRNAGTATGGPAP